MGNLCLMGLNFTVGRFQKFQRRLVETILDKCDYTENPQECRLQNDSALCKYQQMNLSLFRGCWYKNTHVYIFLLVSLEELHYLQHERMMLCI